MTEPSPKTPRPDAGIIYLHGFASSPESTKAQKFSSCARQNEWPIVVPQLDRDDFKSLTISAMVDDVVELLYEQTMIIGSSLGGYVATLAAARDNRVQSMLLLAPAFDFANTLRKKFSDQAIALWREQGSIDAHHHALGGPAPLNYSFFADAERHVGRPDIEIPTVIIQGERDDVIDHEALADVASRAAVRNPKGHLHWIVTDDDHRLVDSTPAALKAGVELGRRTIFRD